MSNIEKTETHYHLQLKASEYDFLDIIEGNDGRIKISFLDSRWRSIEETTKMLKEIIDALPQLNNFNK